MGAQVRLILFEESVHLVAHGENVFAPLQEVTEHHDMFEGRAHNLEIIFNVVQALAGLFFDAADDFASSGAFLVGSSTRSVFERISSRGTGKKQNIDVTFGAKSSRPVHFRLMLVRTQR